MITRTDLDLLARDLKEQLAHGDTAEDRRHVRFAAELIARVANQTNPKFDRKRFLAACGLEGE